MMNTPNSPTATQQVGIALIGLYSLVVAIGFGRFLFTATLPDIMNQLSLSTQVAGWLASANYAGYFVGAMLAMFVPQRFSWRILMVALTASVATALTLAVPDLPLTGWYTVRFLAGVASGLSMILASTYVLHFFAHHNRWKLSTLHYSGIGLGIALSAILTLGVLKFSGHYATVWLLAGLISLPVVGWFYWLRRRYPPNNHSNTQTANPQTNEIEEATNQIIASPKTNWRHAFSGKKLLIFLVVAGYGLSGFGYVTSATFLPVMMAQHLPSNPQIGLWVWLLVGICAMFSTPAWGQLSHRIGIVTMLLILTLAKAVGMLMPVLFNATWAWVVNGILLGLTFSGIVSLSLSYLKDISPQYANVLVGLGTLAYSLGQLLGPIVTVAIAGEDGDFSRGLIVASIGLFVSASMLGFLKWQGKGQAEAHQHH